MLKNINFIKKNFSFKKTQLKKLSINHLDDIHEYSTNKIFFRYLEYEPFKKKSQTKKYIETKIKEADHEKSIWWAIFFQKKCIGTFCIHNINLHRRSCELGFGINPKFWGNGYLKDVIKGILHIILRKNRFCRCEVKTFQNNLATKFSLIKIGFKQEAIMKNFYYDNKIKKHQNGLLFTKII